MIPARLCDVVIMMQRAGTDRRYLLHQCIVCFFI